MTHKHEGCCKHEDKDMMFCQECRKPYCGACGKEWYEKCELNHSYWWSPVSTTPYSEPYTISWGTTTTLNTDCTPTITN